MEYLEAFKYDTEAQARIKCSFVRIYDQNGAYLFTFSRDNDGGMIDTVIGTGKFVEGAEKNELVPIRISEAAAQILYYYLSNVIKVKHGVKENVTRLAKHFQTSKATWTYDNVKDPIFYVRPNSCQWTPANNLVITTVTKDPDGEVQVETDVKEKLPKKTKLALAAAALFALFGN